MSKKRKVNETAPRNSRIFHLARKMFAFLIQINVAIKTNIVNAKENTLHDNNQVKTKTSWR